MSSCGESARLGEGHRDGNLTKVKYILILFFPGFKNYSINVKC